MEAAIRPRATNVATISKMLAFSKRSRNIGKVEKIKSSVLIPSD